MADDNACAVLDVRPIQQEGAWNGGRRACAPPQDGVLWLARFALDEELLGNPYEVHRRLWLAFPGMPSAARPFLFRVGRADRPEVLMQSVLRPAPLESGRCRLIEARPFRLDLRPGAVCGFALRANPTKRDARTGKRRALRTGQEQTEWLARQLQGAAEIVEAQARPEPPLRFSKRGATGLVAPADFAGTLAVLDPERMERALRDGVGPAKGLGCGLLVLGKPRQKRERGSTFR